MDALTQARIGKLESLNLCPSCGAARNRSSGQRAFLHVFFACGAHFSAGQGRAIAAVLPCPTASTTAAAALDSEVRARHTLAATL